MEKPTIVKLTEPAGIGVATFEEAFGDFSEARGKRQEKKAARQQARQTRKATKQAAKQAKKQSRIESRLTRKATRKAGRQEVKAAKQVAKQQRKTDKALMKQDRRTAKTAARIDRRAMRRPDELEPQELIDESALAMQDTPVVEQQYEDATYDEGATNGYGTAETDENAAEPTYHDEAGSDAGESDEEYVEEEYEEEPYDSEEGDYDEGESEDEYGADGEDSSAEGDDSDFNGGTAFEFDSADGSAFQNEAMAKEANVAEILKRIEANKKLIEVIQGKIKDIHTSMNQRLPESQRRKLIEDIKRFKTSLDLRNNRGIELQQQLEAFSNASGKRAAKQAARQEKKAVRQAAKVERKATHQAAKTAKVAARTERKAIHQAAKTAKVAARQERKAIQRPPVQEPGVTEVEQGLNAEIEENRIEVPADEMSSANGIELYAMGDKNEEFVPEDRIIEIKYGADGIGGNVRKFIRPSYVLIGGALVVAYWLNKKYQIVKF